MSTFQDVWSKVRRYFFGEDSETDSDYLASHHKHKKEEQSIHTRGRTVQEHEGQAQSKMTYEYAKPGKFRFPVMDDHSIAKRTSVQKEKVHAQNNSVKAIDKKFPSKKTVNRTQTKTNQSRNVELRDEQKQSLSSNLQPTYENRSNKHPVQDSHSNKDIESQPKQKFTNASFKPSVVPSPIYGYKPYKVKKSKWENNGHIYVKSNDDSLETDGDVFSEVNEELAAAVAEPLHKEQVDRQTEEMDRDSFKSQESQTNDNHVSIEDELPSLHLQEVQSYEEVESLETIDGFYSETEVVLQESEDRVMDDDLSEQEAVSTPDLVNAYADQAEERAVVEEVKPSAPVKSKAVAKQGMKHSTTQNNKGKPTLPFNVMMLPSDRKKYAKSQETKAFTERVSKEEHKQHNGQKLLNGTYQKPSIQLLKYPSVETEDDSDWLKEQADTLEETLTSFNVDAKVVFMTKGPSVTRFEIQPARGVKVTKVTSLTDDMKLALAAKDIRIEAPIPGKNTIGIEVPNRQSKPVFLREILRRKEFIQPDSPLNVALGLDISGQPIVTDLKKMPHGMVAGATGSGKSVCINSILISLLYKANPDEVKMMLIDPKMVELAPYNGLPHLVTPVITDAKQATHALKWVVTEMERRYELFSQKGVRDIGRYNERFSEAADKPALPYILVVIDELADLMMVSPQEVEDAICRIAQKARACGIHLLLATQRPSVDVITGLIKANIPTRVAFSVSSQTDSRTILDMSGAERLLGRGDMLFHENGTPKPIRVQGTFVSDEEIEDVIAFVKKQREPHYLIENGQLEKSALAAVEQDDELFEEVCYFVVEQGNASASSIQRRFRVGYNRAARLVDMMEAKGVVSEAMGSKPRHVLVDDYELEELLSFGE
ncbi:DNA translocase FtsK [Alkalihalobacillus pseudalcaliphilus]|uniref:DNA translocase FtsK n=1 Tax=Alkalihalobacillus pseudalcaliphilus TaxID=79884 RepID=UPI00064DD58E|nr:DNA translocase FtsK [Alkalihalobacillus pseudalcaliphilus]KMK77809.1 DNA translocase [Alkalihalobacillus pseudalcaliphilus]